jgi:hypothetical protein
MSAAKAADDNSDAAPAAMRNLTLRISFVPLSDEAAKAPTPEIGRTMTPNA